MTNEEGVVVVSSHLPGEEPVRSGRYQVMSVECQADFSYWAGVSSIWGKGYTVVNVEHDMEFSDELVDDLVNCPMPNCAHAYQVFPTALQHYIYCATTNRITDEEFERGERARWVEGPEDQWAMWSSIGFCKIAPTEVQDHPLDKMFWPWFEHTINRSVAMAQAEWHLHWPGVKHYHDYDRIPDHLW